MVFDLSTILSMDHQDFRDLIAGYLRDQRISGNNFGLMMGKSKAMGHKYLKGNVSIDNRKEILERLGKEKILEYYSNKKGITSLTDSSPSHNYTRAEDNLKEIFLYGDHETIEAISINLRTFVKKIRSEKRVKDLEQKIGEMDDKLEVLQRRLDHMEHVNHPPVPDVASGGAGTST
jgi:predicted transcriptional regulator